MKKLTLISLLGVAIVLAGCGSQVPDIVTDEIKPFDSSTISQNKDVKKGYVDYAGERFSTIYPKGRTTKTQGEKTSFVAPQNGDKYRANFEVNITKAQKDRTLTQYAENSLDLIQVLVPNVKLISKKEVKIGDMDAIQLKYSGTQGSKTLEREQYLLTNKFVLYIITYTNTEADFKNFNKERNSFVDNLDLP